MKRNVGTADRAVRAVLGLAVGAAGLYYQNWFGLIGLVFLDGGGERSLQMLRARYLFALTGDSGG